MTNMPPDPSSAQGALSVAHGPNTPAQHILESGGEGVMLDWDVPMALPVTEPVDGDIPMALPVTIVKPVEAEAVPVAEPLSPTDPDLDLFPLPTPTTITCPACTTVSPLGQP